MDYTNEKYLRLSSVNVANFVTVRPELRDEKRSCSFKIWKEQMMCFLESQDVACFINNGIIFRHAELKKPQTDEQKLWRRSDRLVKGWILGLIGADVLPMVCELETAWEVWLQLEKIFNSYKTSVSEIQPHEELDYTNEKYSSLSSVNVATFVTVRPQLNEEERSSNFKLWKKQMLCLLKSQNLVGFIKGETKEPQSDEQKLWEITDRHVRLWILGSIGTDVLPYVCELETSQEVWLELDYIFNFVFSAERGFKITCSNLWPSSVNVAKFVKVRPQLNEEERSMIFNTWREQMLCLLKSQDVVGFVEGEMVEPLSVEPKLWGITDRIIKGWILGSIGTDVLQYVCQLETARKVWFELHYIFNFVFSSERVFEITSSNLWPSSFNVAKFVTVRPSRNFKFWKEQMLCLLKSHDVVGFIEEGERVEPQSNEQLWRITDKLIKGWILGSVGADVPQYVCVLETARDVWLELEKIFNNPNYAASQVSTDYGNYLPLYNAALTGDWKTANELFFGKNIEETKARINEHGETALHVAVRSGRENVFVENLVQIMQPEALAIRNSKGWIALHEAASVGNTKAARAMVEKSLDLLYMTDYRDQMPISFAAGYGQKETLEYLISVYKPNMENIPFEGQRGIELLNLIIFNKFMDVALNLVRKYPHLVQPTEDFECALKVMAQIESVFESRQSFSWWEKLIYRCVPVEQSESRPASHAGDIEAPTTYRSSFNCKVDGKWCKSMIWKVIEHLVLEAKDIKDKKKLHNQALQLVNCLCHQMKSLPTIDDRTMQDSMMCAAENGISEIVEVIIEMYPALATSVDENGMTIMHMAVRGRFENVFNLKYKIDCTNKFYNYDNKYDSLLDLCARLPNPERLNIVSGAVLQMQRELQWFNEVEKFVLPIHRLLKKEGKTAKMLFTEQHRELKEEGERWLKDTANACSIANALIATVVFAANFTMPGGVSSETGIPIFFEEPAFVLFATTNVASFFISVTSLLLFLSILTSCFAEQDFLYFLPTRLSHGLLTLFVSITYMVVAFGAAFYLLFGTKRIWFIIPVATYGWFPVASFVRLQFPLLVKLLYSTYGPGIFKKQTRERFDSLRRFLS